MGQFLDVTFHGHERHYKALRELSRRYSGAYAAAVYVAAQDLMSDAVRLTPVDTGWLRRSRYVERPRFYGRGAFFGNLGFSAPYALAVHEGKARHKHGERKFLETAVRRGAAKFIARVVAYTRKFAAAGVTEASAPAFHPDGPFVGPLFRDGRGERRRQPAGSRRGRGARLPRRGR